MAQSQNTNGQPDQNTLTPPPWIQNDYHAPDRDEVLKDPSRWGPGPNGQPAPATPTAPPTPFDHDTFRNAWMATGNNVDAQNSILQQYGINGMSANGTVTLPDGAIMDLRRGAQAGDNTAQWMGVGEVHNGVTNYYNNSGSGQSSSMSTSSTTPVQDPRANDLYNTLLGRAKQSENVSPDDPIISGQTDAFAAQQERARRNYLGDLAESSGPYASGAMLGQSRMTAETMGQNVGNFQSQLMGRELESRRKEIQDALSQMGSMLSDEQKMALEKELGYLNDATQRYGIGTTAATNRYAVDQTAQTAANRLGLDTSNSSADYWLRSQGL
jgi:hypothetical protein